MKTKCPICKSDYIKPLGDATSHCSNTKCELWYHELKTTDWYYVWRKIRYCSFRDTYYWWRNLLFRRYDLIRCGTGKGSWCDKDHLMFEGCKQLLFDYVEKEQGIYFVTTDDHADSEFGNRMKKTNCEQNEYTQKILDLYIDWKVNYPKLISCEEVALDDWSKSSEMVFGVNEKVPSSRPNSITFSSKAGYTDEERKQLLNRHHELEVEVFEMQQDMLHRMVELRPFLWT